ncbi:50S ribosomal protein L11 [uncultured archaeon]|nr:50S ribosomal protein L11 [uncultured archaeon]
MASLTVSAMVEGGKATPAPPLGPSLAPTGVNVGQVIADINEKTKAFAGMTVPIKVIVDKDKKTFEVTVGTPPTSGLIKGEIGVKENVKEEAGVKGKKTIGNLTIEGLLKVAAMKKNSTLAKTVKAQAMEIVGSCVSLGVTVDGKPAKQVAKEIKEGKYDAQLKG